MQVMNKHAYLVKACLLNIPFRTVQQVRDDTLVNGDEDVTRPLSRSRPRQTAVVPHESHLVNHVLPGGQLAPVVVNVVVVLRTVLARRFEVNQLELAG